jgi:branched-chain amino acid transport system substrate-binding protein
VTYTNNDYGKGLADAFQAAYEAAGGKVTINAAHEDGKADYSAEVGALASAGGERLVVAGYVDQGGSGIVRSALDSGAFDTFHFPDGMIGTQLVENFGAEINGSSGQHPSPSEELAAGFTALVDGKFEATSPFAPESYDAAALIMLAMQAAGSVEPGDYKAKIMDVANAPGEKINAGELAKGLQILADGGEIDYVGASDVELIGPGEAAGNYRVVGFEDGKEMTAGRK